MVIDFEAVLDRTKERSKTWDFRTLKPGELPMHGAEHHFACPQPVLDAVRQVAECQIYGYPYFTDDFENNAAGWLKRRFGYDAKPEEVLFTHGIIPGIAYVLQCWCLPGDKVLINTPAYGPFRECIAKNYCFVEESPLIVTDSGAYFDWDDMEAKFKDPDVRAFILCDPHNPTGKNCTREELLKIAELSEKYEVFVITDEVHADFVFDGKKHTCYPAVSEYAREHSAVTINPSKTFNVAGFRTGAVIIPNASMRARADDRNKAVKGYSRTITGIAAFEACYGGACDEYATELSRYVEKLRNYMFSFVEERIPEIKIIKPEATFISWWDVNGLGFKTEKEILSFFADKAGMLVSGASGYESGGSRSDGYIRVAYAFPHSQLRIALERLEKAVRERR